MICYGEFSLKEPEKDLQYINFIFVSFQGYPPLLNPSCIMLQNGQTNFKNFAVRTPQDF